MKNKKNTKKKKPTVTKKKNVKSVVTKKKTTSLGTKTGKTTAKKTVSKSTKKAATKKAVAKVTKKSATPKTTKKVVENKVVKKDLKTTVKDTKSKGKVVHKSSVKNLTHLNKKNEDDLIITREIDLKDLDSYIETENEEAEYLADTAVLDLQEIRKALKESEKEDKTYSMANDEDYNFLIELDSSKKKRKVPSRLLVLILLALVIVILLFTFVKAFVGKDGNKFSVNNVIKNIKKDQEAEKKRLEEEERKTNLFNECLNAQFNDSDTNEEIESSLEELNSYLEKYRVSVLYKDISKGFLYNYKETKSYYAASTIKALDALYVYDKASSGEINLDDTITYTSDFRWTSSKFMQTHKIGDKITIRDLVKNAIMVSDNSSHQMLVSRIGRSTLKEYGKSLGAEYTMEGEDNFGHISANDASLYMENIYYFIINNQELGSELKSYFVDSEQNDLKMEGIDAACKYGEYSELYHNVGIVYDDEPYVLVILTKEGKKKGQEIIREISSKIYNLHKLYHTNRESVCNKKVYAK